MKTALELAIDHCKSQAGLARKLTEATGIEITQQRIWNILRRGQKLPAELVLPIERVTDGKITRHQLRPDLYPLDDEPVCRIAAPTEGATA